MGNTVGSTVGFSRDPELTGEIIYPIWPRNVRECLGIPQEKQESVARGKTTGIPCRPGAITA